MTRWPQNRESVDCLKPGNRDATVLKTKLNKDFPIRAKNFKSKACKCFDIQKEKRTQYCHNILHKNTFLSFKLQQQAQGNRKLLTRAGLQQHFEVVSLGKILRKFPKGAVVSTGVIT